MIRVHRKRPVAANVERILPRLLERYFAKGDRLVKRRASPEKLHRFRIRTKHLRYTLELYEEAAPWLQKPLREFKKLHDVLGFLHDQYTLQLFLEQRQTAAADSAARREYRRLLGHCAARQRRLRLDFMRDWKALQEAGFAKNLRRELHGQIAPR